MDEIELRRLLRLGLGRAIVYAQSHDMREFRDAILNACLHSQAYDVQCEGTHASFMYELVSCLPGKDFDFNEVLRALAGSGDDEDASHRFHIAACLADDGNEAAKRAMYEAYDPGPRYGELVGIEFLQMDGIKGFLFVADKIGALLMMDRKEVDFGYLLSLSIENCGEQPTWDALREASATNPRIDKFRQVAEAEKTHKKAFRPEIPPPTYQELLKKLPVNKPYLLWKWGEQASDEELELAARGLIAATDPKLQLAHLRIFAQRRFPLDPAALIALAEVEQDRMGFAAMKALAHVAHRSVRALAFRMVESGSRWRGETIDLIAQNYEPGDHRIVLRWFDAEDDDEELHRMGFGLRDFWKQHPDEATEDLMLRALYEKGPCSFCRERAVSRMIERGSLPNDVRAECAWDSNDEIRDLVREKPLI